MARRLVLGPFGLPMTTDARGELLIASGEPRQITLFADGPISPGRLALRPNTTDPSPRVPKPLRWRNARAQALDSLQRAAFNADCMRREFRETAQALAGGER